MFCTIYSVINVFNFLTDFGIQAKQVIRHSIMLSVSTTCEIWCELKTNTSDSEFPGITVRRAVSSRHSGNIMWQQRDIGFLLWLEGSGGFLFLKKNHSSSYSRDSFSALCRGKLAVIYYTRRYIHTIEKVTTILIMR